MYILLYIYVNVFKLLNKKYKNNKIKINMNKGGFSSINFFFRLFSTALWSSLHLHRWFASSMVTSQCSHLTESTATTTTITHLQHQPPPLHLSSSSSAQPSHCGCGLRSSSRTWAGTLTKQPASLSTDSHISCSSWRRVRSDHAS